MGGNMRIKTILALAAAILAFGISAAGGLPAAGHIAPDFTLPNDQGGMVSLSSERGKYVVLYFYPKDGTPGCTKEACSFRDLWGPLQAKGAVLLGVSVDSLDSHGKFRADHHLPFPLLSDTAKQVVKSYGVWRYNGERKAWGVVRSTFLIGPDGRLKKVWSPVTVEGHAEEVLRYL